MNHWKAVELVANYWIIQDENEYDEYQDATGDNLMFTTQKDAQNFIDKLNQEAT